MTIEGNKALDVSNCVVDIAMFSFWKQTLLTLVSSFGK